MYVNGHFLCKIYSLLPWTGYTQGSKGGERFLSKIKFEHRIWQNNNNGTDDESDDKDETDKKTQQ